MAWSEKYVSPAGAGLHDGTSEANAWTWAEAAAGYAAGDRVNCVAGTYSESAAVAFSTAGAATTPVWFRGYNATIGDLDAMPVSQRTPGTDMPLISHTANYSLFSGSYCNLSSMAFTTSDTARPAMYARSTNGWIHRCRFEHTGSGGAAYALDKNAAHGCQISNCHFKALSAADFVVLMAGHGDIHSSVFEGGKVGVDLRGSKACPLTNNLFFNQATHAVQLAASVHTNITGCSIYNTGSNGIHIAGQPLIATIRNNYFHTIAGNAINATSAVGGVAISDNIYHAVTGSQLNNIAESIEFDDKTDAADQWSSSTDPTLSSASNGYGVANLIESVGPATYRDLGAVQHEPSGGLLRVGMSGGMNG